MATDLTALVTTLRVSIRASAQKALDQSTPEDVRTKLISEATSFGTGALAANQVWGDIRILAADTNEDLDLAGSLTNAFGGTVGFAKIKLILVHNRSDETLTTPAHTASSQSITVSPADANGFLGPFGDVSDIVTIPPGGSMLFYHPGTGWTVTAGTGDLINIVNPAGGIAAYEILLIGENS